MTATERVPGAVVDDMDDLRAEVGQLRTDVDQLREDAATTRVLAAMADRESSSVQGAIRGIVSGQNALRETQVEQGQVLHGLSEAVGALLAGQGRHEQVLASHDERLASHSEILASHSEILTSHSEILTSHSEILASHSEILASHSEILASHSEMHASHREMLVEILRRLPAREG